MHQRVALPRLERPPHGAARRRCGGAPSIRPSRRQPLLRLGFPSGTKHRGGQHRDRVGCRRQGPLAERAVTSPPHFQEPFQHHRLRAARTAQHDVDEHRVVAATREQGGHRHPFRRVALQRPQRGSRLQAHAPVLVVSRARVPRTGVQRVGASSQRSAMRKAAVRTTGEHPASAGSTCVIGDRLEPVERPERVHRECARRPHHVPAAPAPGRRRRRHARPAGAAPCRGASRSGGRAAPPGSSDCDATSRVVSRTVDLVDDTPDPAEATRIDQAATFGVLLEVHREREPMLDQPPVHVDDVEGTIGSVGERDRAGSAHRSRR